MFRNVKGSSVAAASKPKEFSIRLTPALYRRIKAAAENGGRTINAEIIGRLEASFSFQTVHETINTAASVTASSTAKAVVEELRQALPGIITEITRRSS